MSTGPLTRALRLLRGNFGELGPVLLGVGGGRAITFIVTSILARSLSVAEFGAYSLGYTLMVLVGDFPGLLDASFVRHFGVLESVGSRQKLLRVFLLSKVILFTAIVLAAGSTAYLVAPLLFGTDRHAGLFAAALIAGGCFAVSRSTLAYFQAHRRFVAYGISFFLPSVVGLSMTLVYVSTSVPSPLGSMLVFNTALYAATMLASLLFLFRQLGPPAKPSAGAWQQLLGFASWLVPAGVFSLITQRLDIMILAAQSSNREVGVYGAAVTVSSIVSLFTSNLFVVMLPAATDSVRSGNVIGYTSRALRVSGAIIGLAIAGALVAPLLLRLTVGAAFVEAADELRVLMTAHAFNAISIPLAALVYARGSTHLIFIQRVIELLIMLGLAFLLVPDLHSTGAALAVAGAYLVGGTFIFACGTRPGRSPT